MKHPVQSSSETMITLPDQFKPYLSSLLEDPPILPLNASKEDWDKFLIALKNQWISPLLYWKITTLSSASHLPHNRLTWIYDTALLARLLRKADDWKILQRRCVEWRGRNALETALKRACDWAGISIPFGFDDFSQWPAPVAVESSRHCRPGMEHEWFIDGVFIYVVRIFRVDSISSIFSMVTCVFTLLFPSADNIRASYPPSYRWLLPLSYVRRWLNWGKMWFWKVV